MGKGVSSGMAPQPHSPAAAGLHRCGAHACHSLSGFMESRKACMRRAPQSQEPASTQPAQLSKHTCHSRGVPAACRHLAGAAAHTQLIALDLRNRKQKFSRAVGAHCACSCLPAMFQLSLAPILVWSFCPWRPPGSLFSPLPPAPLTPPPPPPRPPPRSSRSPSPHLWGVVDKWRGEHRHKPGVGWRKESVHRHACAPYMHSTVLPLAPCCSS